MSWIAAYTDAYRGHVIDWASPAHLNSNIACFCPLWGTGKHQDIHELRGRLPDRFWTSLRQIGLPLNGLVSAMSRYDASHLHYTQNL